MIRRATRPLRLHLRRGELADEAELERAIGSRPRGDAAPPRVPRPHRRRRRRGVAGVAAAGRAADRRGGEEGQPRQAAEPARHADRHLRRADDGEPLLRPLLRLAPECRRQEHRALSYPDATATRSPTYRLTPDFQGCDFKDPDHGWDGGRHQWNGGRNDGFVTGNAEGDGSDEFAAGYYLKEDLGFIPHAADAFTLYDRWFCSIMASTYPNRHYQWGAQNGGQKSNLFPPETEQTAGFTWETIFDRALVEGRQRHLLQLRPAVRGPLRPARDLAGRSRSRSSTRRPRPGRCPTSASSTRRSRTAAGETASRPTSTRTATSASARRSCPTSPTPSWSRRSTSAARCSSTTTSGAASSTTSGRASSPTTATNRDDIHENWGFTGFRIPGRRDLPLHARRQRQPHAGHPRVDPQADLLQVRPRPPQQAPPLRDQHRPQLPLEARNIDPPRLPDPVAITAVPCSLGRRLARRRAERPAEAARPGRARDLRVCSTGSATRSSRPPSTRSSASPTASSSRCATRPAEPGQASTTPERVARLPGPGRLAQLGERQLDKLEVTGSSPVTPIA